VSTTNAMMRSNGVLEFISEHLSLGKRFLSYRSSLFNGCRHILPVMLSPRQPRHTTGSRSTGCAVKGSTLAGPNLNIIAWPSGSCL
jgi:hypothetical protein